VVEITVLLGDPRLPDAIKRDGRFNEEDLDATRRLKTALAEYAGHRFHYLDDHGLFASHLFTSPPAFVLNLCDEGFRNQAAHELHIPALLEMSGIPYSGAGPECLALCRNKAWVRAIAADLQIPVPRETYWPGDADRGGLVFPVLVKPNLGDGSVGITQHALARTALDLTTAITQAQVASPGCSLLLQEFLPGREYSVALLGNPATGLNALPVLEVDYSGLSASLPQMLTWESKWNPDSPYWKQIGYCRAELTRADERLLIRDSCILFERLECRDYARFDFRTGADGQIKLLEVNPNPGWCRDGKLNLMAGFAGMSYPGLLQSIIGAAWQRYADRLPGIPTFLSEAAASGDRSGVCRSDSV
jgi:D-alanine-D-alanine ligase